MWTWNMKSFTNLASYILDLEKIVWTLRILSQKSTWNFPFTCEYVTLLQSFHRGTLRIPWGKVKAEVNLIFPLSSNIQLIACYHFCTILRWVTFCDKRSLLKKWFSTSFVYFWFVILIITTYGGMINQAFCEASTVLWSVFYLVFFLRCISQDFTIMCIYFCSIAGHARVSCGECFLMSCRKYLSIFVLTELL